MAQGDAAKHTILYFGPFDPNFRSLSSGTTKYIDKGVEEEAEPPTEKVTGLCFRYMQRQGPGSPKENLVVGVGSIVLRAPVLLNHERHMDGKWFCANSPSYFENDSAMRLLVDMAVANPELRDALGLLIRGLDR